jgi:hypothetical protein
MEPRNLLRALANNAWTCEDLPRHLPALPQWPPALCELVPLDVPPHLARGHLLRRLVGMLDAKELVLFLSRQQFSWPGDPGGDRAGAGHGGVGHFGLPGGQAGQVPLNGSDVAAVAAFSECAKEAFALGLGSELGEGD